MKQKIVAVVLAASLIVANALLPASVRAEGVEVPAPEPQANQETEALSTGGGGSYDITKPVINSVSIDKQGQTVKAGTSITISVDAYDADSGIKSVSATTNEYNYRVRNLTYNEDSKKYEVTITAGSDGASKFVLSKVTVEDNSGNSVDFTEFADSSKVSEQCWVNIESIEKEDSEPPQITAVQLSKGGVALQADSIVKPGDTVHISVQATDNVGLDKAAHPTVQLQVSPYVSNDAARVNISLDYQEASGCYERDLTCTEAMYPGEWHIERIDGMYDLARNSTAVTSTASVLSACKFIFQNEGFDTEAPVYQSVSMEKVGEVVRPGEKVTITVKATDNAGIKSVVVGMLGYASSDRKQQQITLETTGVDGTYQGTFEITEATYPCEWKLSNINIEDISGNKINISASGWNGFSEDLYVNVMNGNTFVAATCNVKLLSFEDEIKSIEVPRRAKLEEITITDIPSVSGLTFKRWRVDEKTSQYGFSDENNKIYAQYDKMLLMCGVRGEKFSDVVSLWYVEIGDKIGLPEIPGYKNIKWDQEVDEAGEVTVVDRITGVMPIFVWAEEGEDTPSGDNTTPPSGDDNTNPGDNGNTDPSPAPDDNTDTRPAPGASLTEEQIAGIVSQIQDTKDGGTVSIPMGSATVIPKEVLEAAKGKDLSLVLQMEGYSWKIDGKSIQNTSLQDIDLKVTRHTDYIPKGVVAQLAGSNPVEQISLSHNGHFGFVAELTLNVGKEYSGYKGNLYYYDSDGKMVFIDAGTVRDNGEVSLSFSHASEYAIVLDGSELASPKTGDASGQTDHLAMFLTLAVLSAAGMAALMARRKRIR